MNTKGLKTVWKLVIFQVLTAFLASAASIPTTIPSTSNTSNSAATVNNTSNPSLTALAARPSCMVLPGRYVNITIRSCQSALNQLVLQPDSSRRVEYQWEGLAIRLTEAPCIISLDCNWPCPDLLLSAREIAGYAYGIIATCHSAAMGWMQTDTAVTWLVTVTGAKRDAVMDATIGQTGNTTFVEDQGGQHNGLTESS